MPYVAPLILAAPVVGYGLLVLGGIATRRGAAGVGLFMTLLMLASTLMVWWAQFRKSNAYEAAYQWINIPVAFTGDQRFQGFGIDLSLRLDHTALATLVAMLVILVAGLLWHRSAGRAEQGPVRFQSNVMLLALGAVGVVVSTDLAELLAFWLIAGIGTYLLLGHRWGTEGAGQRSRLALAFPFVGDIALLCCLGLVYSRFGTLGLDGLYPLLGHSLGVGLKSMTAIAVLLFAAVAVRGCLWPFTAWQTGTVDAPPAAVALVAGLWPIVAGTLLLRMRPFLDHAGVQAPDVVLWALGVAAVAGPVLALIGVELRRSILLASSGAVALALLGIQDPGAAGVGLTMVLAVGAARFGALLAAASVVATMRTSDLRAMGGGWSRMRVTSAALLASAVVLSLAGLAPAMLRPRSLPWVALAAGMALVAAAALRPYLVFAHGELRRRRAFEPARVREVPGVVAGSAITGAVLGLVAIVLGFVPRWVPFLGAGGRAVPAGSDLVWVVAPLAGAAVAAAALLLRRDAVLAACARAGERVGAAWELGAALYARFVERPGGRAMGAVEDRGLGTVESGLSRALVSVGGLTGIAERSLPWVPTVLGVAVVLAVVFGLLAQGLRP